MSDKKTRSALKSLITTNFPSSTGAISASDLREWANAITESARLILEAGEADYIVTSMSLTTPPGSPSDGDTYVVGASATGAWSGQDDNIAIWDGDESPAAWNFVTPTDRMRVQNVADDTAYDWDAGASPAAWTAAASGGSIAVEDEDSSVLTATVLNFTGAGVAVTDAGSGQADITITGSGTTPTQHTITLSSTSTSWSIPASAVRVVLHSNEIALSGADRFLVRIKSGGTTATNVVQMGFQHIRTAGNEHVGAPNAATNTIAGDIASVADDRAFWGQIFFPRDSGKKTQFDTGLAAIDNTANASLRETHGYNGTAQDDDTIEWYTNGGVVTMSGTVMATVFYS